MSESDGLFTSFLLLRGRTNDELYQGDFAIAAEYAS
jgi:hypothetical protein